MRRKAKPWGEAHQREALRRTYEIAAEIAAAGDALSASWLAYVGGCGADAKGYTDTEQEWREGLAGTEARADMKGLSPARIDREVARVRGLAEGRLVRTLERGYRVAHPGGGRSDIVTKQQALACIGAAGPTSRETCVAVPIRVSRILRATP